MTVARTIVVGVDGTAGSARALAWATAEAARTGAAIVAVHVLTYTTEFNREFTVEALTSSWRLALRRKLDGEWTAAARAAGVTVTTDLLEAATTAAGLTAAADRHHADLIVLGVRGHGGLAARILGATTYHVTHRAHQPVVIIPADADVPPIEPSNGTTRVGHGAATR